MHELRDFQTRVISMKRELKEVYYTSRDEGKKSDAKRLVVSTISIQKTIERLLELRRKTRVTKQVLADRKAQLNLRKWSVGLPKRVKDYKKKHRKIEHVHLHKFMETLLQYMETIDTELNSWVVDIETLTELPRPPKE